MLFEILVHGRILFVLYLDEWYVCLTTLVVEAYFYVLEDTKSEELYKSTADNVSWIIGD